MADWYEQILHTQHSWKLSNNLPAKANCLMKKFIRDFLFLLQNNVNNTDEFPSTIIVNKIHNTVNCSVWNGRIEGMRNGNNNVFYTTLWNSDRTAAAQMSQARAHSQIAKFGESKWVKKRTIVTSVRNWKTWTDTTNEEQNERNKQQKNQREWHSQEFFYSCKTPRFQSHQRLSRCSFIYLLLFRVIWIVQVPELVHHCITHCMGYKCMYSLYI